MIEDNSDKRKQQFYEMYKNEIAPIMLQFEPRRKKLKFLIILVCLFSSLILIGGMSNVLIYLLAYIPLAGIIIYILVLVAILLPFCLYFLCLSFKRELKLKSFPYILKIFTNIQWKPKTDTISDVDINNSSLFKIYNTREIDDAFVGNYKGVDFQVSETILSNMGNAGKNPSVTEVFHGVIINYKFNKLIKSKTIVRMKNEDIISDLILLALMLYYIVLYYYSFTPVEKFIAIAVFLIVIMVVVFYKHRPEKCELVKLEDPAFGKRFDVYSADQVEARYLVTPSFMERFYNMKTAFKAKNAKCSFYDDKLMIAFSTNKNLFEFGGISRSLSDPRNIKEFYNELLSIYDLIDTFKLDEKTGL